MKCVKKGEEIKRVKDETARVLVKYSGWEYAAKHEWKESGRK